MTNCINYIKQKYRLQDKDLMITIQTWAAGVTTQSNSSGLTNYSITIIKDPIRQLNYLDECSNQSTIILSPLILNSSLINITRINIYNQKGIDISNLSQPFFTDKCIPFFDENGNYLTVDSRISFFTNYTNFCSKDCIFNGIDQFNYTVCNCLNQAGGFTSMTQSINSSLVGSNIFTFICIKTAFSTKGFFLNAGNYVMIIILCLCSFSLFWFYRRNKTLIDLNYMELIRCDGHFASNEKVSLEEFVSTYNVLPTAKVVVNKEGQSTIKKIEVHDLIGKEHLIKDSKIKKLFKKLHKQKTIEANLLIQTQNNLAPEIVLVNNLNNDIDLVSNKTLVEELKENEQELKENEQELKENEKELNENERENFKIEKLKKIRTIKKMKTLANSSSVQNFHKSFFSAESINIKTKKLIKSKVKIDEIIKEEENLEKIK